VNERIRAREVRLIDENGEMIGVMPPLRALDIARERNLDMVEISPNALPPVCKLMDYGRFKYDQAKKENEARKNQKTITLKEIRMRPRTDDHDVEVKTRKIQEFLADGDKVRVSVQFRGAEMRHPDIGRKLLDEIAEILKGTATIERSPMMEGRMMSMIVSRAPGWEPPKKQVPGNKPKEKTAAYGQLASKSDVLKKRMGGGQKSRFDSADWAMGGQQGAAPGAPGPKKSAVGASGLNSGGGKN